MTTRRGRPPLGDRAATRTLQLRLTDAQRHDLAAVARECRSSMSAVVRDSIDAFVGDFREARVFKRRHGG